MEWFESATVVCTDVDFDIYAKIHVEAIARIHCIHTRYLRSQHYPLFILSLKLFQRQFPTPQLMPQLPCIRPP